MTKKHDQQTNRRTVLKRIGGTAALISIAGCSDDLGADDDTTEQEGEGYEVCIEPAGCVEFTEVPESWVCWHAGYADIGLALGQLDGLLGMNRPDRHLTATDELFYSELPGVSVDPDSVVNLRGDGDSTDEEIFYELDADIHLIDPMFAQHHFDWGEEDVATLGENIAPFFGSHARRKRGYNDEYITTLYDVFETISQVFQEEERYERLENIHADLLSEIETYAPDQRPDVALLWDGSASDFRVGDPKAEGYENKQYRDLGVHDALADYDISYRGDIDYELLLEVDPDVIIFHNDLRDLTREEFEEERVYPMEDHAIGSELSAVQNDRLYRGGFVDQGPIMNLFQTEMLAQQLYPDEFSDGEDLFDRQSVADVINGDF